VSLKRVLEGSSFDEFDKLLSANQEILCGVDRQTLGAGFQELMILLKKHIDENSEYLECHLH
jgi:hypothetical protein